jgi:hypothetical protein
VPIRFPGEKLGKLSGNWSIPVSRITDDGSFTVEISQAQAGHFFWACAAHDLEAVPEAQKKSAAVTLPTKPLPERLNSLLSLQHFRVNCTASR